MRINDNVEGETLSRCIAPRRKIYREPVQWERETDQILGRLIPAYRRLDKSENGQDCSGPSET